MRVHAEGCLAACGACTRAGFRSQCGATGGSSAERGGAEDSAGEGGGGGANAHEAGRRGLLPFSGELLGQAGHGGDAAGALVRTAGSGAAVEADADLRRLRVRGEHEGQLAGDLPSPADVPQPEHVGAHVAAQDLPEVYVAVREGAARGEGAAADHRAAAAAADDAGSDRAGKGGEDRGVRGGGEQDQGRASDERADARRCAAGSSVHGADSAGGGEEEGGADDEVEGDERDAAVRAGNHLHCEWGGEGLRLSGHCERKCVCAKTED